MRARTLILSLVAAFALCALFIPRSQAATGTSTSTWTNPTTYTDGTALPAANIVGYSFQCTFTPTNGTAAPCVDFAPATATGPRTSQVHTMTYDGPRGGQQCIQVRTRVVSGAESDWSVILANSCKPFTPATPNPPTNVGLTIQVTADVFDLKLQRDGRYYLSRHVGYPRQEVQGAAKYPVAGLAAGVTMCQIPRAQVAGAKSSQGVLVARCS